MVRYKSGHLQTYTLEKLSCSKSLRFSEIQPANVENDLFNYHLQQLVKIELVLKVNNQYSLSKLGYKYLTGIALDGRAKYNAFKLCTLCALLVSETTVLY